MPIYSFVVITCSFTKLSLFLITSNIQDSDGHRLPPGTVEADFAKYPQIEETMRELSPIPSSARTIADFPGPQNVCFICGMVTSPRWIEHARHFFKHDLSLEDPNELLHRQLLWEAASVVGQADLCIQWSTEFGTMRREVHNAKRKIKYEQDADYREAKCAQSKNYRAIKLGKKKEVKVKYTSDSDSDSDFV